MIKRLFSQLFPSYCLLCALPSKNSRLVCTECEDQLPLATANASTLCLFQYEPPISTLITQLKFHGDLKIARYFAQCFQNKLRNAASLPEYIMPVPLHPERLKERGFNQSLEIAKPIGRYYQIPVDTKTCIRIKNTRAQSSLPAQQRKTNMKNAFALAYPIQAKHVAILDDVITTGSTIAAITELLKHTGVKIIDAWCCANT